MLRTKALLSALFLVAALPSLAQPAAAGLPTGVARVTSVEGVTEYRLANGLKILLIPDRSIDTVTVNVTYLVGSRHEGYGETGMAHLLEHLMFRGTPRFPSIKADFQRRGARYNGSTSFDRTNYYETFPAGEKTLDYVLDVEADRMVNASIARRDLDSEMTAVRNEFESGKTAPTACCASAWRRAPISGTTTEKRSSGRAPTSSTCRSSGCGRSTVTTTSRTMRCC